MTNCPSKLLLLADSRLEDHRFKVVKSLGRPNYLSVSIQAERLVEHALQIVDARQVGSVSHDQLDSVAQFSKRPIQRHLLIGRKVVPDRKIVRCAKHDIADEVVETVDVSNPSHRFPSSRECECPVLAGFRLTPTGPDRPRQAQIRSAKIDSEVKAILGPP